LLRWLQLQPQRAVAVLAVLLGLLLCALVANDLARDYQQQFAAAKTKTGSITQLLEEHARQSMRRVELSLSLAAQEVQEQYRAQGKVSARTGTRLQIFLPQDGLIASFAVLDDKGQTLASTLTEKPAELPSAADRDFYRAQLDPAQTGLFVGQAVKSRISGLWIIPVSIRLEGGVGGYLVGMVDPEYFQHLYQSIDMGDNGFVTLFTAQGWAIARWPFSSEIAERNWLDSPLFKKHIANATEGSVQEADAVDGTPSVYSYSALQEYPLVIATGVSLDATLQPWRERVLLECAGLLLVLLVLGAFTAMLVAQLRRRVQAESALKLSEISLLMSSLPTLWIGQDGRVLRVNQAACDLHGRTEEQMLAMSIPDLNPGMSWERWPAHWQRLRKAHNMRFETLHRNARGEDVPVEADLNFIEFEGREYNFAFIRDLGVRKQAEAEIQRSAAMLRGAIDAVDEAFVLFDADDRLVYCNAKYLQLYPDLQDVLVPGSRFEDLIRLGAARGLYRESAGREEAWIAERLRAHREGNEARIQKRDDGRVLRVIDRKTPDGNIVGIRVDITEMVRATEEAQEASRTKSQFLANMSHEIRTPMNAILGLLALLQNTDLSSTQRDYAAKTTSAAQSLLGLLNDILDFSKVEAGKMELDPQPFRLDRMLRDIAVILSSNLGGKAIEVLFDTGPGVPSVVVADAMRLQQVLVNLGSNAIKFTEQGQVVLRVRQLPVVVDAAAGADAAAASTCRIEFAIQDSGIGIAPDKQQHIFTGFSQAEASTTRRYGGTGLGLAICKRLVELMGGSLALQSAPGLGSTFSFSLELPLVGDVPAELADAPRLSVAPKRVLIVDDNPVARDILAGLTNSWGWPTTLASSGVQALALLRASLASAAAPFEVIYLDWQMQGMDGWEAARQIRELFRTAAVQPRIVMLSANGRDTPMLRTLQEQAQIDGFLFKPVTASALQDAANGHLSVDARLHVHKRSSGRALAGLRILVVEDNLINQQVAEELLNAEGALVSLAANGQLGVDAVAASQPAFDVVLMDIQMPVLDGYGATRKIREELGLTELPIVAMTANAMASDRLACLAAGMNEHVGKPFDMAHLVTVLLKMVGREAPPEGLAPAALPYGVPNAGASNATPLPLDSGDSPYLDVVSAVDRLSGLTSLYIDVLQDFIVSLDSVEGDFRQAAAQGQVATLLAQMHSLKGTAATLGAMPLSEHAARMEARYRNPPQGLVPLDDLPALLALVQASQRAGRQALQSLKAAEEDAPAAPSEPDMLPDRVAAMALLLELSGLLRSSNLAALERFALRRQSLNALPAAAVEELHLALQALDLDLALRLCEAHVANLAVH
jgi:PAS domain S-box-containing protein